jgi:hypothetical protein
MKNFVPFAQAKKDKNGREIYLQTMKLNNEWVVQIFENNKFIGVDKAFGRLVDAEKYIISELEKV